MSHPRTLPLALVFATLLLPSTLAEPSTRTSRNSTPSLVSLIRRQAPRLNPGVLQLALQAHSCAIAAGVDADSDLLTIIDYSRPSTEPRLWVLDLHRKSILFRELVAHGQHSGGNRAVIFSNRPNSRQSSIGLFLTDETYRGRNGYSLRLDGLEPGINDKARDRAIVMHGAPYVDGALARARGRLGRSWGCPAVRGTVARPLIDTIKNGSLIFAYYPDEAWLGHSRFLAGGSACSP